MEHRKGKNMSYINLLKRKSGFTLIELLVVIAIIGILVTIVVVAINPVKLVGEANDAKKREELNQMKNALQLYYNDYNNYPLKADLVGDLEGSDKYTRSLPDASYEYSGPDEDGVPIGEYRAGVALDYDDTGDGETISDCGLVPGTWSVHYVICPD